MHAFQCLKSAYCLRCRSACLRVTVGAFGQRLHVLLAAGSAAASPPVAASTPVPAQRWQELLHRDSRYGFARVAPSTVTWRSPMHSSSADWVRGVARLISSASKMFPITL